SLKKLRKKARATRTFLSCRNAFHDPAIGKPETRCMSELLASVVYGVTPLHPEPPLRAMGRSSQQSSPRKTPSPSGTPPGSRSDAVFGSGGVEKSIPTTAPIAAADAADTRPCQPGTAGSSVEHHVLEGARLHRSKTAPRVETRRWNGSRRRCWRRRFICGGSGCGDGRSRGGGRRRVGGRRRRDGGGPSRRRLGFLGSPHDPLLEERAHRRHH